MKPGNRNLGLSVVAAMLLAVAPIVSATDYASVDTTSAAALRATLHALIDDHTRFPYTSTADDTWDILEAADQDLDDPSSVTTIYRNASYAKQGGGNSLYNREHVWPKSYGFPNDGSANYPFTDAHHLFIADDGYNSSRSNRPFAFCGPACTEKPTEFNDGDGGETGSYPADSNWGEGSFHEGTWEVWHARRGDIARAMFYMDLRYEGGAHGITGANEPDLRLTDDRALIAQSNTGQNESVAYMGMLSVLLQWHEEDPVDAREQLRNEVVASYQGNRNPFIDHPEYAQCLYANVCDGVPPVDGPAVWLNEFHYDNNKGDINEFVEVAGDAGVDLTGWSVVGYNGRDGRAYKTVTLNAVLPNQEGCMGTQTIEFAGMQNGSPDGLALVDASGTVVEAIAYEGAFVGSDGPAAGVTFADIGVAETSKGSANNSLQRIGSGADADAFVWSSPAPNSPGVPNVNQSFSGCGSDTFPPAQPTGVSATGEDSQVTLAWDMGTESDLAGYRVLRSQTSGGQLTSLSSTLITTSIFTDTSAVNGTTYFYAVVAVDTAGNESDPSAEVSATPEAVTEPTTGAWINEFHYDNDGTDVGEFVEVAGAAGLDLNGWSLVAYNGNGGGAYKTINLSGVIPDLSSGYGVLAFDFGGLQNGSPDGLALVSRFGEVVEFIAYEGDLFAVDGPASGQTAADIGVAETSTTPVGFSLQRAGSSTQGDGFQWSGPLAATPGLINAGQSFAVGDNIPPVAVATEDCNGLECIFDGSGSSDSDGVIVTYSWDFGDGSAATGPLVSHTYSESGEFAVTLTVTDDVGSNGQQVIPVAVTGADALVLSVTGYKVKGRQRVDLLWSGSSTPGIDIYRDGALLAASVTGNSYTDNINIKGGGSYSYKVCESATTTCSADSTVTF